MNTNAHIEYLHTWNSQFIEDGDHAVETWISQFIEGGDHAVETVPHFIDKW